MTDEEIIKAVRDGTHTLVPMPIGERRFFIGYTKDADLPDDHYGLILDLDPDKFESEEVGGCMMGGLSASADGEWNIEDRSDREIPF